MTAEPLRQPSRERPGGGGNGLVMLLVVLMLLIAIGLALFAGMQGGNPLLLLGGVGLGMLLVFLLAGFYSLQPNEAAAITLFGDYQGTDRVEGLRWT